LELSEFTLEPLRQDEEFILYRGKHQGEPPASPSSILLLAALSPRPAPVSLKQIEHEYALRSELDSEWAVRPLAIANHNGQTMLILEDPGGKPLDRPIREPMETGRFLRFAIGLASAVSLLHARGLIHKNLKPSNILIHSQTNQVWLMGFGITSRLRREHQLPEPPEFLAGTYPTWRPNKPDE
jgi:serine/threonine protein kinase